MEHFIAELFVTFQDEGYCRYRQERQQELLDILEQVERGSQAMGKDHWERYRPATDAWSELMSIEGTDNFLCGLRVGARMALLLGLE